MKPKQRQQRTPKDQKSKKENQTLGLCRLYIVYIKQKLGSPRMRNPKDVNSIETLQVLFIKVSCLRWLQNPSKKHAKTTKTNKLHHRNDLFCYKNFLGRISKKNLLQFFLQEKKTSNILFIKKRKKKTSPPASPEVSQEEVLRSAQFDLLRRGKMGGGWGSEWLCASVLLCFLFLGYLGWWCFSRGLPVFFPGVDFSS